MFVRSLNIKEFRGIKACDKALKFSNFTVLIGKNNAGKSSILEALSLLPDPNINDYITNTSKIENLRKLHQGSLKDVLYLYAGSSNLQFGIESSAAIIEITEQGPKTFWNNKEGSIGKEISRIYELPQNKLPEIIQFFGLMLIFLKEKTFFH